MIEIKTIEELPKAADFLMDEIKINRITAFYGEMGAGKTSLIKEICKKLDVTDQVNSPTFSIINEYHTKTGEIIYHFDFYRLKNEDELLDLGYEDYLFSGNICLIEWPEKIEDFLPPETLKIQILVKANGTRIIIK
ncbi:MAG: tRNA (adenosine(37)-N6)-threonylcarbamoyltransferase complex ATPase subunit type 1 TsaE [Bacteroidales bacterium]|nr:tRNA (adenosine(37)-N6)-threonylcarbamoyltransferase complex ATPase subunit type 1 TsaE [Bacteroidales bacterium]